MWNTLAERSHGTKISDTEDRTSLRERGREGDDERGRDREKER